MTDGTRPVPLGNRRDEAVAARVRTGRWEKLLSWRHFIGEEDSPNCPEGCDSYSGCWDSPPVYTALAGGAEDVAVDLSDAIAFYQGTQEYDGDPADDGVLIIDFPAELVAPQQACLDPAASAGFNMTAVENHVSTRLDSTATLRFLDGCAAASVKFWYHVKRSQSQEYTEFCPPELAARRQSVTIARGGGATVPIQGGSRLVDDPARDLALNITSLPDGIDVYVNGDRQAELRESGFPPISVNGSVATWAITIDVPGA
eukprot:gene8591-6444_t